MVQAKLLLTVTCMLAGGLAFAQSRPNTTESTPGATRDSNHRFSVLDKDRDGCLSREEAAAYPRLLENFDAIDTDKDGKLTKEEVMSPRPDKPFKHVATRLDDRLKAADSDGDGALSKTEAGTAKLNYIADHFDQFDANKDGKVSRDELRSTLMGHIHLK